MRFVFEVAAKIETLRLDGERRYLLQGSLTVAGGDGEPMQLGVNVPRELWATTDVGGVLTFSQDAEPSII